MMRWLTRTEPQYPIRFGPLPSGPIGNAPNVTTKMGADTRIIPFDSLREFAANELAKRMLDTYGSPREFLIGGIGVDLSTLVCSLCGGRFPPIGRARFVIDHHGETRYVHRGCGDDIDVRSWAHGRLDSCENGCDICLPEGA